MVSPCTDKLDLDRFSRDLSKYKPWLSTESWGAWEDFLNNIDSIAAVSTDVHWMLPDLQAAGIARRSSLQAQPQVTLSNEAQMLLQKETRIPNPVRMLIVIFVSMHILYLYVPSNS